MVFSTGAANGSNRTLTALSRWSILDKQLPAVEKIHTIHVYDFDNTLFKTPLPNAKLWAGPTIGMLMNPSSFVNGGWWHDSRILAATGEGIAAEESRAWNGWWNDKIVELVELSMKQQDALCVLLTGRAEAGFGELVKRMTVSKGLEFDLMSLKPAVGPDNERFSSTLKFKQIFLETLMETYKDAGEIRIYEDRIKHVKSFRDFLAAYNQSLGAKGYNAARSPIQGEVIQVADLATNLDPIVEVAEVQNLVDAHNTSISQAVPRGPGVRGDRLEIKKTVFYTGYMIDPADSQRLLALVEISPNPNDNELKLHANNIMICPRPCPKSILDKVGGMGSKMRWEVTGIGSFENSIWAVCLNPVPTSAKFHTDNPSPLVVLAVRKGARPMDVNKINNWTPLGADKRFQFDTTVGEKIILRVEPENLNEGAYESLFANKHGKRKHAGDDDTRSRPNGHAGGHRGFHTGRGGGKFRGGNRGNFRGNRGGGSAKRGGRGGNHHYKSLDDVGSNRGGYGQQVSYDDGHNQGGYSQPQHQQGAWQGGNGLPPPQGPGRGGGYGAGGRS